MQLMRRKEIPCFLGMEGEGILVGSSRVKNKILRAPKKGGLHLLSGCLGDGHQVLSVWSCALLNWGYQICDAVGQHGP